MTERENLFWADVLRVIVIFGVIVIHVAADVITEWGHFSPSWWWAANIEDSLVRGCVPVFIMLSGALLLPKQESLPDFFHKRLKRILIPFIVWNILYLVWKKYFFEPSLGLAEALGRVAGDGVHFHLWFLYIIAGLYLVTPIFRILTAHATKQDLIYFLGLWFVVASLLPFMEQITQLFTGARFHIKLPAEAATGFIGYFVLGHFLMKYATEKSVRSAVLIWAASLSVCIAGTYLLSAHFHHYVNLLYDNFAPNVIFYTASFFILLKFSGPVLEKNLPLAFRKLTLSFSQASFGIYLIHPMILDVFRRGRWGFVLKADLHHPLWMIPLTAIAIYLFSFLLIWLIQKIPYGKRIT